MGGVQPICCVGKEYPIETGQPVMPVDLSECAPKADKEEVKDVLNQLDELHQVVANLQGEMQRQREENDKLLDAGDQLCIENERLREVVQTMDTEKAWGTFDVLEAHYKHLEEHKRSMSETTAQDEASPVRTLDVSRSSKDQVVDASDSEGSPSSLKSLISGSFCMPDQADEAAGSPFTTLQIPSPDICQDKSHLAADDPHDVPPAELCRKQS